MPSVSLFEIAHARSGDKGTGANVAVIAYTPEGFALLREKLTAEAIERYFKPLGVGTVIRHEVANLGAFNFILPGVSAEGGSRSLRIDAQGKSLGQVTLEMPIDVPDEILSKCRRRRA